MEPTLEYLGTEQLIERGNSLAHLITSARDCGVEDSALIAYADQMLELVIGELLRRGAHLHAS